MDWHHSLDATTRTAEGWCGMKCDNCIHYHWYYDWCDKWECEVDARSVHDCFEEKDGKS